MRLTIALIFFLLYSITGFSQTGSYYLTQYDLDEIGQSNYNFDVAQDGKGLIYLANLKGVIVSDGIDWSLIETPYSVFSLAFDDANNLYVGGRKEIAVINNAANSSQSYRVIAKVKQEVFKIFYHNEIVYFLTENTLYVYSTLTQKLITMDNKTEDEFLDILAINESVYLSSSEIGIQKIIEGKLEVASIDFPKNTQGVRSSTSGDQFVYTTQGEYFIKRTKDQEFVEFIIDDEGYLEKNTAIKISWVNSSLLAVSTLSGGVVFIDAVTGKIEQYINYENGLADNEVLTMFVSKNNIVWCTTPQGVSIIAPEIPIRNYGSYPGLAGKIQVVYDYNSRLFVGTSIGLFELVKKSVFDEVISYKKITETQVEAAPVADPKKKKGLFRKKKNAKKPLAVAQNKTYYKKQVQRNLLSQSFEYERIEPIDSKVIQLVEYNETLLVGTLAGIYELKEKEAIRIFEEAIVHMFKPDKRSLLIVSTYNKEVKVLKQNNDSWLETGLLDGLDDFVEQIEQGKDGELWLCGADSLYRILLDDAYSLEDVEVYPIHNPHWERIYANQYNDRTYFLNSSGYYYYEDHSIKKDMVLERKIGLPTDVLLSSANNLWVNTGHFWYGRNNDLSNSLNFISFFEDPRYISEAGESDYWVVAGNNQLYKINGNELSSISRNFELFLEKTRVDSLLIPATELLGNIDQQSSLSFKFASPDFTNIYQPEFQYRLVGLSSTWSEWSRTNNEITFPYLPAGGYHLEVRARDALGNVQNSETIDFNILAPYWKRPWFYLIEMIFFGGLMAISFLINRRKHRLTILSRLLTYLTLILIVEFVQTLAESKFETNQSPVINFFIQVGIALSILPAELLLRKFITRKQRNEVETEKKMEVIKE